MNKFQIFSFLLIFSLCSCSSLILQKALFGVKTPKIKSEYQIKGFLVQHDFDTNHVALLKPDAYKELTNISSKYFSTWEVYNSNGELLIPNNDSTNSCIGNIEYFVKYFNENSCRVDTTRTLREDIISKLINPEKFEKSEFSDNYTLVLYWSTFMGKYSQDILNLEKIANLSESRFSVIKVNMDLREDIKDFTISLKN